MTRNPVGDNQEFSAAYWSAMVNAHAFEFVRSGLDPSVGSGSWDVDVAAGEAQVDTTVVSPASTTVTLDAADGTNDRVDLVTVDSSGTVTDVTGTAAADPVAPDIPSGEVLLAAVLVPGGSSSLSAADIRDYRILSRTVEDVDVEASSGLVPDDTIAVWSGAIVNIPSGWVLCDGNNGTPDLRDRFVIGAGSSYNVDGTGGVDTVTLGVDEIPSHRHGYTYDRISILGSSEVQSGSDKGDYSQGGTTDYTGGDGAHENRPPYHALAYIMKV